MSITRNDFKFLESNSNVDSVLISDGFEMTAFEKSLLGSPRLYKCDTDE